MKKMLKRLCTGFLALATVVTALPTTPVHAESKQYWTESKERVGIVEKVMNDGSIGSTFNEGHLTVEGEDAYCIDINTDFKNGYKTRADASTRMSADQISDVALSIEYVKQYTDSHNGISKNHAYLLRQLVVWQRLSVHLGWQCDNVRASYDEIPKATQDEVFAGAKAFVKENKGRYECGGYIYSGEGQELGQFWAKLNVGNAKLQKTSSNTSITDGNGNYSIAGATYGVFADKDCTKQLATLTTDENGNTDVVEVTADTVYIKELSAPAGYKVDTNIYAVYSAKEKAKSSVSDFKRGMVQEQQSRQTGRLEKQEQRKKNIADKRMELQKAQEARQVQRKADGSATTGATRPHERPVTASTIPKPSVEKMQEVKRPATAPTPKASEPVKTNVIKERPLSSGASDKKAPQPTQTVHRQNVEKVVSQETRQNDTKDRRIKVQQTQSVQKNQQTIEKTRNLVTKKGQKKK